MKPKILIVDDDPVMLNIYSRVFSGHDYVVVFANSVAVASALLVLNHYDLLVTDQMLGDGLGTELVLLFSQKNPGAKSLLVSGSLSEADPQALAAVSACLGKPLDIDRFMETIAKVLDKPLVRPVDNKP